MMKKRAARFLSIILAACLLAGCGSAGTSKNSGTGSGTKDSFESAEIYLSTPVMLAGTESCFRIHADDWILSYGNDIEISSSDESVATVEKDEKNEALIIKGVSAGTATITAKVRGAEDSKEIRVVEGGDAEELLLSSESLTLKSFDSVEYSVALENAPEGVEHLNANVYSSRESIISVEGNWSIYKLNLTIHCSSAAGKTPDITILITDGDNPEKVVGYAIVPAVVE